MAKSIVDQDRASVVICNLKHEIIYMNPAVVISNAKGDGDKLIGRSLLECHNPESRDKIQPGKELSQVQQDYLVDVIMTWIQKEIERQEGNQKMSISANKNEKL